jgi:hypothetical protein
MHKIPNELQTVVDAGIDIGQTRRIVHKECSEGKNAALSIRRTMSGYVFHCFRCGLKGFIGTKKLPSDQIVRMVNRFTEKPVELLPKLELPHDAIFMIKVTDKGLKSHEWAPVEAFVWAWDGGLTDRDMFEYKFMWSESMHRVLVPIFDEENTMIGILCRDPSWDKETSVGSKYILKKDQSVNHRIYFTCHQLDSKRVIFVEDVLSAIRVHKATGAETVALLNHHIGNDLFFEYQLYDMGVWLDMDAVHDAAKAVAAGRAAGLNIKKITTSSDPKKYNDIGIRTILHGQMSWTFNHEWRN